MNKLLEHHWPGNVRELQHIISTAVLLAKDIIHSKHIIFQGSSIDKLSSLVNFPIKYYPGKPLIDSLEILTNNIERKYVKKALSIADNNITHAAEIFGTDRKNFYKKMNKYGINV
jgi:DNA-binding NtrC family response regulator